MKTTYSYALALVFVAFINTIGYSQQDCIESIVVCGNSSFDLDVNGIGIQEVSGLNACSSQENNSIWLEVNIETTGTLAFTLTPSSTAITEDYDFFIFGPNATCNNLGQAIRCSTTNPAAAGQGNNLTGLSTASTDTSEGPGANGDSFVSAINALAGESYFIVIDRPIGESPFNLEWTGTATFPSNPINPIPQNLLSASLCDNIPPFDDGISEFNLTDLQNDIINGQPNVQVSFHNSESDANINNNPLGSIFNSSSANQTIYARIENSGTGCFIINSIELETLQSPSFNQPTQFGVCDNDDDGDNTNGITEFDFNVKTAEITAGITGNYNVSYYLSLNDAENNTSSLPFIYTNQAPTPTTIFVRIEDLDSNCIGFTDFQILVNEIPEANNVTLVQCDEFGAQDGISIFNLNEFYDEVTGNTPDRFLSFFSNLNDAQLDNNSIDPIGYQNSSPLETLVVKVTNSSTQCANYAEITLDISFTNANDAIISVCDTDGDEDGFTLFDLSLADDQVLDGLPAGLDLVYYETLDDALVEQNPLPNDYTNEVAFNQTIFVRVENDNNCFGINELALEVLTLPNVETEFETLYCLNDFPEPIIIDGGVFDAVPNNFYYEWSTGETTIEIEVNEPGIYTVIVRNVAGCSKERTVTVTASNIATITDIQVTDATENNTITVLVTGEGDYEFALDDPNGFYQDSNVFNNVLPGIYSVFVRDKNGCGITEEMVSVVGFPKFFTPNGDNQNDFWQVKGISSQFQPNTVIYIFDKYGKLVSEINPLGSGWDGTYNGNPLPSSDYWFSVTLQDGRQFSSHFALKR
ncbi:MAG: gliding motility-associated C-terminal domain-containing protein [Winogradskyella sp.]|uniref:T9SS type B sorting domain-containing protein n=1 Tax=Winogradskyella sp. TaxID=1883156 RepID=UPI000F3C3567|nr:T9SS type B sorting domain-containing protein [Winogradskyella sp.]RNC84905.1 MAG: gliding motility-associated C-terminal domain-containing protein [Winogradskyella sp.]